jgi:predicted tellurium resistance membrane protein TerC
METIFNQWDVPLGSMALLYTVIFSRFDLSKSHPALKLLVLTLAVFVGYGTYLQVSHRLPQLTGRAELVWATLEITLAVLGFIAIAVHARRRQQKSPS